MVSLRTIRLEAHGFAKMQDRFLDLALSGQNDAQVVVNLLIIRLEAHGLAEMRERFIYAALSGI
jgi:hypothetical protein